MAITLPTRMPDGTTRDVEYLPLEEVLTVLPVHMATARRYLARGDWHGARLAGRWYMTRDDMADAVALARGDEGFRPPEQPPQIGAAIDDDTLDDLGGVR